MKRLVSLVHRPAITAGLPETLFREAAAVERHPFVLGMITPALGMHFLPQGMPASEKGILTSARGMRFPAKGILTAGRGMLTSERGMLTPARGIVTLPQGMVTPARGMHPSAPKNHPPALGKAFPTRKLVISACFEPHHALQRR